MEIVVPLDSSPFERILDVDASMCKTYGVVIDGVSFATDDPVEPGEEVGQSFFSEHEDLIIGAAEEKLIDRHHEARNPFGV